MTEGGGAQSVASVGEVDDRRFAGFGLAGGGKGDGVRLLLDGAPLRMRRVWGLPPARRER
jgi:hypothetical protein